MEGGVGCIISEGQWVFVGVPNAVKEKINFLKNKLNKCVGTLFFRSGYIVQVVMTEDKPEEVLLRRFRREVSKAGVIQECNHRRFFENKQEERRLLLLPATFDPADAASSPSYAWVLQCSNKLTNNYDLFLLKLFVPA